MQEAYSKLRPWLIGLQPEYSRPGILVSPRLFYLSEQPDLEVNTKLTVTDFDPCKARYLLPPRTCTDEKYHRAQIGYQQGYQSFSNLKTARSTQMESRSPKSCTPVIDDYRLIAEDGFNDDERVRAELIQAVIKEKPMCCCPHTVTKWNLPSYHNERKNQRIVLELRQLGNENKWLE